MGVGALAKQLRKMIPRTAVDKSLKLGEKFAIRGDPNADWYLSSERAVADWYKKKNKIGAAMTHTGDSVKTHPFYRFLKARGVNNKEIETLDLLPWLENNPVVTPEMAEDFLLNRRAGLMRSRVRVRSDADRFSANRQAKTVEEPRGVGWYMTRNDRNQLSEMLADEVEWDEPFEAWQDPSDQQWTLRDRNSGDQRGSWFDDTPEGEPPDEMFSDTNLAYAWREHMGAGTYDEYLPLLERMHQAREPYVGFDTWLQDEGFELNDYGTGGGYFDDLARWEASQRQPELPLDPAQQYYLGSKVEDVMPAEWRTYNQNFVDQGEDFNKETYAEKIFSPETFATARRNAVQGEMERLMLKRDAVLEGISNPAQRQQMDDWFAEQIAWRKDQLARTPESRDTSWGSGMPNEYGTHWGGISNPVMHARFNVDVPSVDLTPITVPEGANALERLTNKGFRFETNPYPGHERLAYEQRLYDPAGQQVALGHGYFDPANESTVSPELAEAALEEIRGNPLSRASIETWLNSQEQQLLDTGRPPIQTVDPRKPSGEKGTVIAEFQEDMQQQANKAWAESSYRAGPKFRPYEVPSAEVPVPSLRQIQEQSGIRPKRFYTGQKDGEGNPIYKWRMEESPDYYGPQDVSGRIVDRQGLEYDSPEEAFQAYLESFRDEPLSGSQLRRFGYDTMEVSPGEFGLIRREPFGDFSRVEDVPTQVESGLVTNWINENWRDPAPDWTPEEVQWATGYQPIVKEDGSVLIGNAREPYQYMREDVNAEGMGVGFSSPEDAIRHTVATPADPQDWRRRLSGNALYEQPLYTGEHDDWIMKALMLQSARRGDDFMSWPLGRRMAVVNYLKSQFDLGKSRFGNIYGFDPVDPQGNVLGAAEGSIYGKGKGIGKAMEVAKEQHERLGQPFQPDYFHIPSTGNTSGLFPPGIQDNPDMVRKNVMPTRGFRWNEETRKKLLEAGMPFFMLGGLGLGNLLATDYHPIQYD